MHYVLSRSERACVQGRTIDIPTKVQQKMCDWLQRADSDPGIEVEARFTAVNGRAWHAVEEYLRSACHWRSEQDVVVLTFANNIRRCGNDDLMSKVKIEHADMQAYAVRVAIAHESVVSGPFPASPPVMTRRRIRTSYMLPDFPSMRFDISRVLLTDTELYQVEIEYVPVPMVPGTVQAFADCIYRILAAMQASELVISETIRMRLSDFYRNTFCQGGEPYFIAAQPETLHMHHLSALKTTGYYVSKKLDGERGLLMCFPDGSCFILDRRLDWRCVHVADSAVRPGLTVIDVESLPAQKLVAIDFLIHDGLDLRGQESNTLKVRLRLLDTWIKCWNGALRVCVKKYISFKPGMRTSLNSIMAGGDGLIFIRERDPYPKTARWATLLKWKPQSGNSIDFAVSTNDGIPYVSNHGGGLVAFRPDNQRLLVNLDSADMTIQNMDIVECAFSTEQNMFVPLRVRRDKHKPNFVAVAADIWRAIQQPVSMRHLQIVSGETWKAHLSTVRLAHAERLLDGLISVPGRPVRVFGPLGHINRAAGKRGSHTEAATEMADIATLDSLDQHYSTQAVFAEYISEATAALAPSGQLSLFFMDGLKVLSACRGSSLKLRAEFDHHLFAESFDVSQDFAEFFTIQCPPANSSTDSNNSRRCLLMPDALALRLATHGMFVHATGEFPPGTGLTQAETEYNELFRWTILRKRAPMLNWRPATAREFAQISDAVPGDEVVVSCRAEPICDTLQLISGGTFKSTDLGKLAHFYLTTICVIGDGTSTTHSPHIDASQSNMYFVQGADTEKYFVVGFRDLCHDGLFPIPIRVFPIRRPTQPANEHNRILDELLSRPMTRVNGSWTVKDLCILASSEPCLRDVKTTGKRRQELYDDLVLVCKSA